MRRFAPLLLLLAAAAPAPAVNPVVTMAMAVPMPRPAPAATGPVFLPAPVPNPDAYAPVGVIQKSKTELNPATFSASSKGYGGDGFVSNSTAQLEQERKMKPSGGLALSMPLQ